MRTSSLERNTKETQIKLSVNLDGTGKADIKTGIAFFDHMLTLLAFHSDFDLTIEGHGDHEWVGMDPHHLIEDIAIALGKCIDEALGDRRGIKRYGAFTIPMDEALVTANLDISGRPFLVFNADLTGNPKLGGYDVEMTEEFFRALAFNAGITLHLNANYGKNNHHLIEGMFKSTARSLKEAVSIDESKADLVPSSKGII